MRHDLLGFGAFEQLDIAILQLHDAVVRAPRMLVARAHGEACPAIELAGSIEIAHRVHDMVETMGQGAAHFIGENAVGTSSWLTIFWMIWPSSSLLARAEIQSGSV